MNRAQIAATIAACEALAKRLRTKLHAEAEADYRQQGMVPSWKLPGGITVSGSTSNPTVAVTDEAAFLAWVAEKYPTEVETIRRVRPAWQGRFLAGVVERGNPPCAPDGEVIPGLEWRPGGEFGGISMRLTSAAKDVLASQVEAIAEGARPLELPTSAFTPVEVEAA